jgi:hypothetical protein
MSLFKRLNSSIRSGARTCQKAARAIWRFLSEADVDVNAAKASDLDDRVFQPKRR